MEYINCFEKEFKYKLYSNVEKIMRPTISKRNISSYKIVLNDEIAPIRVFYPEKVSQLDDVIIYVHGISLVSGCGNYYSDICMDLAIKTKRLVVAIDYDEEKKYLDILDDCRRCVEYLCNEFNKMNIKNSHITLMGDSIGATIVHGINKILGNKLRSILVSPVLSGNYFEDGLVDKNDKVNALLINNLKNYYSNSLKFKKNYNDSFVFPLLDKYLSSDEEVFVVTSQNDYLKNEAFKYSEITGCDIVEIPVVGHGFLKNMELDIENVFYTEILGFLD